MDYNLLNVILKDFDNLRNNKNLKHMETTTDDEGYTVEVYKVLLEDNLYIKVLYIKVREHNDSYSDNDYLSSIQFVKAKEVNKIEYINID